MKTEKNDVFTAHIDKKGRTQSVKEHSVNVSVLD